MRNGNPERGVPVFSRRGDGDGKADRLSQKIFPEFGGRHLPQPGLGPPVVVVVDIVGDFREDFAECRAPPQVELVLRVAEEALHRGVVPAVPPPRHGLAYAPVGEVFAVFPRRVMAPLVGMEEERAGEPIHRIQLPERLDHEGEADGLRQRPRDDLVRRGVLDRGQVASLLAMGAVVEVAYVGQQVLPRPSDGELAVELVREHGVRLQSLGDPPQRVRPPYRAFQAVLPHQPLDFLPVHRNTEEPWHQHRDRPRPLRPALEVIDFPDDEEIGVVPGFVCVVAGSGDAELLAHPGDVEPEFPGVSLFGPVDYLESFFDGDFDGW